MEEIRAELDLNWKYRGSQIILASDPVPSRPLATSLVSDSGSALECRATIPYPSRPEYGIHGRSSASHYFMFFFLSGIICDKR